MEKMIVEYATVFSEGNQSVHVRKDGALLNSHAWKVILQCV